MRYLLAVCTLLVMSLAAPRPSHAQVFDWSSLDKLNRKLAGHVVDHTNNHGVDRRIWSPILGQPRDMYVYLPPGYSPARAYSLVLFFHTAYVDEHIFIGTKWAAELDQMIVAGCVPPMVVVMVDGMLDGRNRFGAPHSFYINGCFGRFGDHILFEVIPFLRQTYSIRTERQALGILGASAGGYGAMSLALRHRDLFGAAGSLAGPLNLRYTNVDREYREDFDPATYRWNTRYDPDDVVAAFYGGLKRTRASKFMEPVFGSGDAVVGRVMQTNPADLIFSTNLQPGELALYVNYGGRDNWNFDAQSASFVWLARQRGIEVTVESDPRAKHNLPYFHTAARQGLFWMGRHLLPPAARMPGS